MDLFVPSSRACVINGSIFDPSQSISIHCHRNQVALAPSPSASGRLVTSPVALYHRYRTIAIALITPSPFIAALAPNHRTTAPSPLPPGRARTILIAPSSSHHLHCHQHHRTNTAPQHALPYQPSPPSTPPANSNSSATVCFSQH